MKVALILAIICLVIAFVEHVTGTRFLTDMLGWVLLAGIFWLAQGL